MKLEFRKHRKRDIEPQETGYYLKNEFLHRHLNKSLGILRERIKDLTLEEKQKTDEGKVLRFYYEKQTEITKKTELKKKDYYKSLGEKAKQTKIFNLGLRIENLEQRKNKQIEFFNEKIKETEDLIEKLK